MAVPEEEAVSEDSLSEVPVDLEPEVLEAVEAPVAVPEAAEAAESEAAEAEAEAVAAASLAAEEALLEPPVAWGVPAVPKKFSEMQSLTQEA